MHVLSCTKMFFHADPWNDYWLSNEQVRYYLNELIGNPVFEGFVVFENSKLIAACLDINVLGGMEKNFL